MIFLNLEYTSVTRACPNFLFLKWRAMALRTERPFGILGVVIVSIKQVDEQEELFLDR